MTASEMYPEWRGHYKNTKKGHKEQPNSEKQFVDHTKCYQM